MDDRQIYWEDVGFLHYKFNDDELQFIRDEVNKIKKSPSDYVRWNRELAGNLEHEYKISPDVYDKLYDLLIPLEKAYYDIFSDFRGSGDVCVNEVDTVVDNAWVNFQKKYEFNPPHVHKGVFSFVIWLDIPYTHNDELKTPHAAAALAKRSGAFSFFYLSPNGNIRERPIYADKEYRNTVLFFPAKLMHCVYPFYTSDGERISVSGNIVYKT